jgi:hypothetical protein
MNKEGINRLKEELKRSVSSEITKLKEEVHIKYILTERYGKQNDKLHDLKSKYDHGK